MRMEWPSHESHLKGATGDNDWSLMGSMGMEIALKLRGKGIALQAKGDGNRPIFAKDREHHSRTRGKGWPVSHGQREGAANLQDKRDGEAIPTGH